MPAASAASMGVQAHKPSSLQCCIQDPSKWTAIFPFVRGVAACLVGVGSAATRMCPTNGLPSCVDLHSIAHGGFCCLVLRMPSFLPSCCQTRSSHGIRIARAPSDRRWQLYGSFLLHSCAATATSSFSLQTSTPWHQLPTVVVVAWRCVRAHLQSHPNSFRVGPLRRQNASATRTGVPLLEL